MRLFTAYSIAAVVLAGLVSGCQADRIGAADALTVSDGLKVSIEFTMTLPDNTVATSNRGREPLTYIHGRQQILPGLERALTGMKAGEHRTIELPAEQAFGPYDEKKRVTIQRDKLPAGVEAGKILRSPDGYIGTVLALEGNTAVIDLNHPLAGKNLRIDVTVLRIEPAPSGSAEPQSNR